MNSEKAYINYFKAIFFASRRRKQIELHHNPNQWDAGGCFLLWQPVCLPLRRASQQLRRRGMEMRFDKNRFLHLTFVISGKGIRFQTITCFFRKSRLHPKKVVFADKNSSKRKFILYKRKKERSHEDELCLRIQRKSARRLKRFLRLYVKETFGGMPRSVNYWFTPFRWHKTNSCPSEF